MGVCSPEYRKVVEAQEKRVNQNKRDTVSLIVKLIAVITTVGAIVTFFLIK
ncbi:hypothetical protein [Fredinandcohnia sp. 179-A 10B2 NHS]|uniref:hypothetical protein n=1 Tax=Fredinandcohnia sp. 179-A 10B2 NHS TaxID=3235176 RepID=UPI00399F7704